MTVMAENFAQAQDSLAENLPGYTRRTHQMALAEVWEQAVADGRHALLEAGTGTGKSLALLIPAVIWAVRYGKRVIVATATKALQGQYAGKDLPFLQEHLGIDFTWAVLKGRSNYPCHAKIAELHVPTPEQAKVLALVEEISTPQAVLDMETADREDFPSLPENEWRDLAMGAGECPGAKHCPFGEKCIAERAKNKAAAAQVVVTNTAYLMTDLLLRNTTNGNVALLGEIDRVVIDEAHTLSDAATSALEETLSENAFLRLGRDMASYMDSEELDEDLALAVEPAARALWATVSRAYRAFAARERSSDPMALSQAKMMGKELVMGEDLGPLVVALSLAVDRARTEIISHRVYDEDVKMRRSRLLNRSDRALAQIREYCLDSDDVTVRWAELMTSTWKGQQTERVLLRSAPVSVAPVLRKILWDAVPTALVSATLASGTKKKGGPDFGYVAETVGLDQRLVDADGQPRDPDAVEYSAGSPFDFPRQAVLFTPDENVPAPSGDTLPAWEGYSRSATKWLVEQSQGGALLLFTSRRNMNASYDLLAEGFRAQGLHVMKQGDAPNGELVRMMKEDGNAVLFALRTFFEGIDIQGSALRLVVLDKLPFAVPSDLVYKARADAMVRRHGRWADFDRIMVPQMVLILTQGFGRLIRHADDRGVVAILDPRLKSKGYGKKILRALPPARQTTDPRVAGEFLAASR